MGIEPTNPNIQDGCFNIPSYEVKRIWIFHCPTLYRAAKRFSAYARTVVDTWRDGKTSVQITTRRQFIRTILFLIPENFPRARVQIVSRRLRRCRRRRSGYGSASRSVVVPTSLHIIRNRHPSSMIWTEPFYNGSSSESRHHNSVKWPWMKSVKRASKRAWHASERTKKIVTRCQCATNAWYFCLGRPTHPRISDEN